LSLLELANHNEDIERLLKKGYALRLDSSHLVVRDIPYLDSQLALQWGAIVTKLEFIDKVRVQQQDHQIFFAGGIPHGLDGRPVPNLGGGPATLSLAKSDVTVERTFSNKPKDAANNWVSYPDFFAKVESYERVIAGPAIERHGANPFTFKVDHDEAGESVFKYQDTLTSRAEIGDLAAKFKGDVIAIIGLGGTGAFLLDYFVKTPVKEVRGFDGDIFHVHTAYRSPGKLEDADLGLPKVEVYQRRYENFRHGLVLRRKYIDTSCAEDLQGTTFAFVCVDKGPARAQIFELLIALKIPFIDVGMGLNRVGAAGPLGGMLRATYYPAEDATKIRDMGLAELADRPDDEYRQNVQIGELNALNACLAIIRYKKLRGFYSDTAPSLHMLLELGDLKLFSEPLA
jgi:hypothetical protein